MSRFIIRGQQPLNGAFKPSGNKNAALPMLAACLLTDQPVVLDRLPLIDDVHVMLNLLASMGVDVQLRGHRVTLRAEHIRNHKLSKEECRQIRGSILLAGPLAARCGRAVLSAPGGDVIGRRRLDTHLYGLRRLGMGVSLDTAASAFRFVRKKLRGGQIILDEASVTATENILMAASLIPETTTLYNAACEPHVQDLCFLLRKMGAEINGIGTNFLTIRGAEKLRGAAHTIQPDHIEIGSFIAAAAATGGALEIPAADLPSMEIIRRTFARLGIAWKCKDHTIFFSAPARPRIRKDLGNAVPKIEDGVWPAFPSDLMSVALVLATQSRGSVLFFEKLFESRMYFVDRLIDMGAQIVQCDPHRVLVNGPAPLRGSRLSSPDIRAGMALVIAALCARGESVIENAEMIDRGYERLEQRLRALGADIRRKK